MKIKPRQIIFNFSYDGALVNTSLSEWIDEYRQSDMRNAKALDLKQIGESISEGYLKEIEKLKLEIVELKTPTPSPTDNTRISKLTLMHRLNEIGKWGEFKTLLGNLPEIVQDAWTLAQSISPTDPLFQENAPTIKAYLKLSDEEFDNLLK